MPLFPDIADKSLVRIVAPAAEPLTVNQAKKHCSLPETVTDFDEQFQAWITAAREQVEIDTERAFIAQTWELAMDRLPVPTPYYSGNLTPQNYVNRAIELWRPPVQSITSFGYYSQLGVWTTMVENVDYLTDFAGSPSRITPLTGLSWPPCQPRPRSVVITFVAGYGSIGVPSIAVQAMKLLIGHWWRTREAAGERPTRDHDRAYVSLINSLRWRA